MSVYIRGLNLPAEPMILILHPDGNISTEDYEIGANAKAIELPPHGRLIDEDAIYNCDPLYRMITYQGNWVYSRKAIQYAPTVIEAEEVSE